MLSKTKWDGRFYELMAASGALDYFLVRPRDIDMRTWWETGVAPFQAAHYQIDDWEEEKNAAH